MQVTQKSQKSGNRNVPRSGVSAKRRKLFGKTAALCRAAATTVQKHAEPSHASHCAQISVVSDRAESCRIVVPGTPRFRVPSSAFRVPRSAFPYPPLPPVQIGGAPCPTQRIHPMKIKITKRTHFKINICQ